MVSIDNKINYEEAYKKYLTNARKTGNSLITRCPFHSDNKPSFSVDLTTGMYHCFGCEEKGNFINFKAKMDNTDTSTAYIKLCEEYNIEYEKEEDTNPKVYTAEVYAKEKYLPLLYLSTYWGITNDKKGIKIPYYNEQGKEVATRYRGKNKAFKWAKNSKIIPYGLQRTMCLNDNDYVILVEGESDTQTLALAGFPVLGIPGATLFKPEWVKYLKNKEVYIHNEGDVGGNLFKTKICQILYEKNYTKKVYEIKCNSLGFKDPNEMFKDSIKTYNENIVLDNYRLFTSKIKELLFEKSCEINIKDVWEKAKMPLPDMPLLKIPSDYELTKDGIIYKDGKGEITRICRIPVIINSILYNLDDETEELEIGFYKFKKWNYFITTRSIINNQRTILQLGEKGIPITGENAKKMSDYLGQLDELNFDTIKCRKCVSQLGWYGKYFLPHYAGELQLRQESTSKKLITGYEPKGSIDVWISVIKPLMKNDLFNCILKTSFAAPLIKIINYRTFMVHIWADSRAGKTAALKSALSVWGNPDDIMGTFNSTTVGLERLASFYNDLPLGVDEKQVAGDNTRFVNNLIYMLGLGQGKTRGTKNGGIQNRVSWRTAIITTGEEPISSENSQNGISTRVIELYGKLFDVEKNASFMHRFTTTNCGTAGKKYIEYIIKNYVENKEESKIISIYENIYNELESVGTGNISSHISSLSVICTADYLANKIIFDDDNLNKSVEFGKRILSKLELQKDSDIVDKAYEYIKSWINVNINYFTQMSKTVIYGFREKIDGKNYFFVQPSILQTEITKQGYSYKKIIKGFNERNYLLVENSQSRNTVRRTNNGVTTRYVAILVEEDFEGLTKLEQTRIENREIDEATEQEYISKLKK